MEREHIVAVRKNSDGDIVQFKTSIRHMIGVFASAFAEFRVADGPFLYARRFGENFTRSERGLPAAACEFSKHSALGGVGRAKFCLSTEQNNQFCSVERGILENQCSRKTVSRANGTGSGWKKPDYPHANNCSYFVDLTRASFFRVLPSKNTEWQNAPY